MLDAQADVASSLESKPAPQKQIRRKHQPPELVVQDLHKSFGTHKVLKGINLDIPQGDLVAIVGGSGSGKTVLLDHLFAAMMPDQGRVFAADHESPGTPLRDLATADERTLDRIRIHWAVVFQRNALFTGSVYENIALWLREVRHLTDAEIRPIAREVIEAVQLDPDRVLMKDRDELSGGMAKRVALARALSMDPLLTFYDEPTTGLDPQHAAQIHALILDMHERPTPDGSPRTGVIVTHDTDLLRRLRPRIVMLHDGKVTFDGSYGSFSRSDDPAIRPYIEDMPVLQRRFVMGQ